VNTGFGGSAGSRTSQLTLLQSALLQLTQSGVLTEGDFTPSMANYDLGLHCMPVTWVRATMLVRCNHLLRGHSGVCLEVIDAIIRLLQKGLIPIIPLRGSVSASGDLMPLSYIGGVLEGNPDIKVRWQKGPESRVISAKEALKIAGLSPIVLGPKEGLGVVNGTAVSAAVAALAAYDANQLAVLSQILTAMSCEALSGTAENYHPFIAEIRPHVGQIKVAANIRNFLTGTKLAETPENKDRVCPGLFQDRYALRSASQWLGPQLEDLTSAVSQLLVELNSTADNPVIDVSAEEVLSGANFQAASVTSAVEKIRLSLQMIGKLLFSLTSELINPDLNKGLPANLVADDPSLSFTMKGVDINMAAYMSELAFLANPVSSHVQSAEMHNQSVNSLALISSRYTMQAVDVVSLMCAAHLYVVCQALDLRVLHNCYLEALDSHIQSISQEIFKELHPENLEKLQKQILQAAHKSWNGSANYDLQDRCRFLTEAITPVLVNNIQKQGAEMSDQADCIALIKTFQGRVLQESISLFDSMRSDFFKEQHTASYLGSASKTLYTFVRKDLNVPFHQGLVEHPTIAHTGQVKEPQQKTVGSWVSIIYAAIRDGRLHQPVMACIRNSQHE